MATWSEHPVTHVGSDQYYVKVIKGMLTDSGSGANPAQEVKISNCSSNGDP